MDPGPTASTASTTDAVLAALADGPASAADVARAAGIGRSTAAKVLVKLATIGVVERHRGSSDSTGRVPDEWSLTAVAPMSEPAPVATGNPSPGRLAKGELAGLVLAWLDAHPGEHSPTQIAKALDRSSGAVANALGRLAGAGDVTQTSQAPRRYRAAGS